MNINPEISCELSMKSMLHSLSSPQFQSECKVSSDEKIQSSSIIIESPNFSRKSSVEHHDHIEGILTGKKPDPNLKGRSASISGKIDLLSAQKYSLSSERFSSPKQRQSEKNHELPSVSLKAGSSIFVESLSWLQALQRKYDV
jgi:hypothetical protein